jgi:hypothetical protein
LFFTVFILNASFMLFSPRTWFRLPEWLGLAGSLRLKRKYYEIGWGAGQVRILGGLLLAGVVFMLYEMLIRPR